MSSSATPYGARPVGTLSASGSFTGKVRHYGIASGYGTAIFYGDFVKLVAAGTVEKDTGTTSLTPVGIFLGVSYTDPNTSQKTFSQFYPASTAADDISAYVLDDPNVLFEMQADGSAAVTNIGNNVAVVQTAGSTSIGTSKNAIDISTAATTTATLPVRIVDISPKSDNASGDSFTDLVAKFNAGHIMDNTTGI
jgi:hypothetical protein|tara:strand:- start:3399 stop:3980 length:582 start_codon:yes stop_codon:yes gene_type:complete